MTGDAGKVVGNDRGTCKLVGVTAGVISSSRLPDLAEKVQDFAPGKSIICCVGRIGPPWSAIQGTCATACGLEDALRYKGGSTQR